MKNMKVCRTHERCAKACFFLKRHTWPRKGTWPICSTMHAIARSVSISLRRKWSNSDSPENDNLKKVFNKRSWCGKNHTIRPSWNTLGATTFRCKRKFKEKYISILLFYFAIKINNDFRKFISFKNQICSVC